MDKYLQQILLDVNTIIIPGLGALTVTNSKTGEMMFMSYLKYDDGKLASYISEKEGMSENDAKNLIAKYVRDIQAKLDKGESYNMFQFGRFFKNKDGDIDFEGWSADASTTNGGVNDAVIPLDATTEDLPTTETETVDDAPIPAEDAFSPEEKPEIAHRAPIDEIIEPHTEAITIPEFHETAEDEAEESVETAIQDDLTIISTPKTATSLDEILEKSEAEQPLAESQSVPESVEEISKPEPIVNQTQDESRVQVENIYIPPVEPVSETIVEAARNSPDLTKKENAPEPKARKRRSAGFWILIVLIFLVIAGGIATLLFYDQVKTYLPFLESKRMEAEQKKNDTVSAEELNESAAGLEAAENERITGEGQPEEAPAEEVAPEQAETIAPEATAPEAVATSNDGNKPYHVIGGAFNSKENADRYAAKLKSGGNNSVIVGQFDGLYLVSIDSYASKQEATGAINGFEAITSKAWVFKWP